MIYIKRKTIQKTLKEKLNDFVESIDDESLQNNIKKHTIITGGSIASMFLGEHVNDYDLYFNDRQTVIDTCNYYIKKMEETKKIIKGQLILLTYNSDIVQDILNADLTILHEYMNEYRKKQLEKEDEDIINTYETPLDEIEDLEINTFKLAHTYKFSFRIIDNIYNTFKNDQERVKIFNKGSWGTTTKEDEKYAKLGEPNDIDDNNNEQNQKYIPKFISANAITLSDDIQIIVRFYGDAEEIHKNFDFVHAMNYWVASENKLYTKTESLESLLSKSLIYRGSKYPLASIFRARKFINRGFSIDAGQYLKMAFQLNEMDLNDPYTLEEQLTGVDLLYFLEILSDMRRKMFYDDNFTPSTDYFIKIVEKIFE